MVPWLDPRVARFPDPETALKEPDGLLAAGGSLDPRFLLAAYSQCIFPWFSEGEPILWWSPSTRASIDPGALKISESLSKTLRNKPWSVSLDGDFEAMVELCAATPRAGQPGTWIGADMKLGYAGLHRAGLAHSVEVFFEGQLAGGLFGVKLGGMFFGESMVSLRPDASKAALAALCLSADALGIELIDCQMMTPHLKTMGAQEISRQALRERVHGLVQRAKPEDWKGALPEFSFAQALMKPAPAAAPTRAKPAR
jgi:leucyl/phenylalanyl-tRNA--protein transferase